MDYTAHEILQATTLEWVGSRSLLQQIFPTQELNQGLIVSIEGGFFTNWTTREAYSHKFPNMWKNSV